MARLREKGYRGDVKSQAAVKPGILSAVFADSYPGDEGRISICKERKLLLHVSPVIYSKTILTCPSRHSL